MADLADDIHSVENGGPRPKSRASERTPLLAQAGPSQTPWRLHVNERSAQARLQPYIDRAIARQKYQYFLAKLIKWGVNQFHSSAPSYGGSFGNYSYSSGTKRKAGCPKTRLAIAGLGALGTLTASVLARAKLKGTNQPELAETHARELEKFIGQCQLFVGDVGSAVSPEIDAQVLEFVRQFDAIEDKAVEFLGLNDNNLEFPNVCARYGSKQNHLDQTVGGRKRSRTIYMGIGIFNAVLPEFRNTCVERATIYSFLRNERCSRYRTGYQTLMADLEDKAPLVIEKGYPGSQLKDEASERVAWSVIPGRTAEERLRPYIDRAKSNYKWHQLIEFKERPWLGLGTNILIILQVGVGAMVTVCTVQKQTEMSRMQIASLGAIGTFTASILARAKGTNQPERTDVHTRELEKFILECEMFVEDVGTTSGPEIDAQVARFVRQFDAIEDRAIDQGRRWEPATAITNVATA
ncbi:hypothetical protein RHS04_02625 [Rhizoctonia solani]|uniref:SMODS and SLOG-associating 2TM effector domain-containing protein n=1 Tax=Rhizoctonia solani TaxID=456999 RepID=A0A8H7HG70_9AGAM|nr:hypothetical protein RHS04_02625 [Rhizoctonia solani]KAF8758892.1 hypothetical protein RHS01_02879 [Rhizoctonia solani]